MSAYHGEISRCDCLAIHRPLRYNKVSGLNSIRLCRSGKVNLFTRPRRFGKTLNMSMLKNFFEIGADKTLFDGLLISKETALCEEYFGKFPVIFISLKDVDGLRFEDARKRLIKKVGTEAERSYGIAFCRKRCKVICER